MKKMNVHVLHNCGWIGNEPNIHTQEESEEALFPTGITIVPGGSLEDETDINAKIAHRDYADEDNEPLMPTGFVAQEEGSEPEDNPGGCKGCDDFSDQPLYFTTLPNYIPRI